MCVGGWGSESKEKGGFLLENKTSKHETHRRILYVSETPDHIHGCCRKLGESRKQLSGPPHKAPSAGLRSDGGFLGHGLLNVNHSSGTVSALPAPAVCAHLGFRAGVLTSSPWCSSRAISQPHVHDPVRQSREGTALKHLSPHTRKTTCRTRWILPSYTPTDTDKETLNTEPNCGG